MKQRGLEKFLLDQGIFYHILNPLVAKKRLDDGSRLRKNDVRDARGLAITEFFKQSKPFKSCFSNPLYRELTDLSRYYDQQTEDIKRERNRRHKVLQLSFPNFDDEIDLGSLSGLATLRLFPHPETLIQFSLDEIVQQILDLHLKGIGQIRATTLAKYLWRARSRSYPAVAGNSFILIQVQDRVDTIMRLLGSRNKTIDHMVELSSQLPEYEIIRSIPGIGENTAVRIIGELGDMRRFEKRSQVNSFIGIVLVEIQSGEYTAQ